MKNVFLFLVAGIFGVIFIIWYLQPWVKVIEPTVTPTNNNQQSTQPPSKFSLENAPSESLKGQILSFSGNVTWQSRTATESSKLNEPITIQQGEKITTEDSGLVKIQFPETGTINIFPNTELEFAQTLPSNIVLNQPQGTTEFLKDGPNPVSIRSLHLLIKLNEGNFSIAADKENLRIIVKALKGSAQAAYNDIEATTQVIDIKQGQQLIYDNELRTTKVKNF